jgi:serine/threonine protein phosphatase PrpC
MAPADHREFQEICFEIDNELTTRGLALDTQGDHRGAYRAFEASYVLTSSESSLVSLLGALLKLGEPFLVAAAFRALRDELGAAGDTRDPALAAELIAIQRKFDEADAECKLRRAAAAADGRSAATLYAAGLASNAQGDPTTAYRFFASAYAAEPSTAAFLSMLNMKLKARSLPVAELVLRHFERSLDEALAITEAEAEMAGRKQDEATEALRLMRAAQVAHVLSSPLISTPLKLRAAELAGRLRAGGHEANRAGDLAEAHGCFQAAYALQRHPADGISMGNMKAKSGDLHGARDDYLDLLAVADADEARAAEEKARAPRAADAADEAAAAARRQQGVLITTPKGAAPLTPAQRETVVLKLAALDDGAANGGGATPGSRARAVAPPPAAVAPKAARPAATEEAAAVAKSGAPPTPVSVDTTTKDAAAARAAKIEAAASAAQAAAQAAAAGAAPAPAAAAAAARAAPPAAPKAAAVPPLVSKDAHAPSSDDEGAADDEPDDADARARSSDDEYADDDDELQLPIVRAIYAASSAAGGSSTGSSAHADGSARPNQDCFFALESAVGLVIGVLDGHGGALGAVASQAAARAMQAWLEVDANARLLQSDAQNALATLFQEGHVAALDAIGQATGAVDAAGKWPSGSAAIDARVKTPLDARTGLPAEGGTTATVVAIVGGRQLLIAHVGDSDAVLGGQALDGGGVSAEKLTADHTPCSVTEYVRTRALGAEASQLSFVYDCPTAELLHVFDTNGDSPALSVEAAEKADMRGVGARARARGRASRRGLPRLVRLPRAPRTDARFIPARIALLSIYPSIHPPIHPSIHPCLCPACRLLPCSPEFRLQVGARGAARPRRRAGAKARQRTAAPRGYALARRRAPADVRAHMEARGHAAGPAGARRLARATRTYCWYARRRAAAPPDAHWSASRAPPIALERALIASLAPSLCAAAAARSQARTACGTCGNTTRRSRR